MTRKDYVLLSDTLRACKPDRTDPALPTWRMCMFKVCEALQKDNKAFDSARFIVDCYNPPGSSIF